MNGCNVTVIGGGPAGVLSAAHFAKRGAKVTVYEKRPLQKQDAPGRGWSIALGELATHCIEEAGLSADFGAAGRREGAVGIFGAAEPRYMGGFGPPTGTYKPPSTLSLTRAWIIKHLRKECEEKYPNSVKFMDGYSLVGGNLQAGEAIFTQDETGGGVGGNDQEVEREVKVSADIVVGADGAGSKTRSILQELDKDLKVKQEFISVTVVGFLLPLKENTDPKTYADLETPSGLPFQAVPKNWTEKILGAVTIFVIPAKDANPELVFFVVGSRAGGTDVNASLTASERWWGEAHTRTVEETMQQLIVAFPRVPTAWLQSCAEACCDPNRRNIRPNFVECSKLGVGRCVLVGDAAHSVQPNLGYGCTAGLDDAMHLSSLAAEELKSDGKNSNSTPDGMTPELVSIAEAWTRERLHDAHAYRRLSKSVSDVELYKHHKNLWALLKALPIAIAHYMGRMKFPGKRILAPPPKASVAMVNGGMRPKEVIEAYEASATRVGAVLLTVVAVALGVGIKGVGYVIQKLPVM